MAHCSSCTKFRRISCDFPFYQFLLAEWPCAYRHQISNIVARMNANFDLKSVMNELKVNVTVTIHPTTFVELLKAFRSQHRTWRLLTFLWRAAVKYGIAYTNNTLCWFVCDSFWRRPCPRRSPRPSERNPMRSKMCSKCHHKERANTSLSARNGIAA